MIKKATINPKNTKDNCCFAYSIVAALHHQEIDHHSERIKKLAPYVNNYNWKDINFPAEKKDWKTFERNNKDIALNILSVPFNEKKLSIIRRSEYNHKRLHQVDLLMITDNENNWHYVAVKNISRLCRGVTSNHNGDFYYRNCLHPYRTDNAVKKLERLCNNHDHCGLKMPAEGKNILKHRSKGKSLHIPHIIYADLEASFRKIHSCQPNPENSYTEKKNVHIPSGYSLHLLRTYDQILTTHFRGVGCMQKFARALKIMAMMITDTPKKPMTPLTDEEKYQHKKSKYCHICKTRFNYDKDNENYESYHKVRDHDHYTGKYRGAAHSKCNLEYQIPEEIPVVFHNGSKYDYHFIINELTKGIDGIKCLGKDTEKYISFSVPLSKDGESFTYKLKFIDSFRLINRSLANLTDNLPELNEQIREKCKEKCKYITRKNDTSNHTNH